MEDRKLFEKVIEFLDQKKSSATSAGRLMLDIGEFFLGSPYVFGTLERREVEHLVINLREFDCFTFVENAIALAKLIEAGEKSFEAFRGMLRRLRYRQGRLQGYSSRLHYFSDWIYDNQKKGILKNVTPELGGEPFIKPLNFMTSHSDLYPPLKHQGIFREMKTVERRISRRPLFFIPKGKLRLIEDRIHDGDLIAITTDLQGLDVKHVGLAVKLKNRIHFLHASSKEGKVVLSKETLYRYLMGSRVHSGIMVIRVR